MQLQFQSALEWPLKLLNTAIIFLQVSQMNITDNATFPCGLAPSFPPLLGISPSIDYVQAAVALVLGVTGFLLNLFILMMVLCYKILHQRIMYLALQIVIIDLIYTLTIPLVIFISGVSRTWLFGEVMCNIYGIIHDFFAMFRFTTTLILTLDRFISVFWPFFYLQKSSHFILTLGGVMYVISILRALLPITGIMSCYVYVPAIKTCTAFSSCSEGCFWFVAGATSVVIIFGALVPFVLYIVLFCKIRRIKRLYIPPLGTSSFGDSERKVGDISPTPGIVKAKTSIPSSHSFDSRVCVVTSDGTFELRRGSAPAVFCSRLSSVPATGMEFGVTTCSIPAEFGSVHSGLDSCNPSTGDICLQHKTEFTESQMDESVSSGILGPQKGSSGITDDFPPKSEIPSSQNTTGPISNGTETMHIVSPVRDDPEDKSACRTHSISSDGASRTLHSHSISSDGDHMKSRMERHNVRANVTMFILLMSVIGCTAPAFVLYGVQQFLTKPISALFIVNMLVGRTFFNLLPIVDGFAIMRHQEFRVALNKLVKVIRQKLRHS